MDRYTAEACEVSVDYSQISCLTAAGVGRGHALAVSVGGQLSNLYAANVSYSSPNVADYTASWDDTAAGQASGGASTRGGEWVVLNGRNFGTVAEDRIDEVTRFVFPFSWMCARRGGARVSGVEHSPSQMVQLVARRVLGAAPTLERWFI